MARRHGAPQRQTLTSCKPSLTDASVTSLMSDGQRWYQTKTFGTKQNRLPSTKRSGKGNGDGSATRCGSPYLMSQASPWNGTPRDSEKLTKTDMAEMYACWSWGHRNDMGPAEEGLPKTSALEECGCGPMFPRKWRGLMMMIKTKKYRDSNPNTPLNQNYKPAPIPMSYKNLWLWGRQFTYICRKYN